jgi:membrane fusion protein, multidrug efflux system
VPEAHVAESLTTTTWKNRVTLRQTRSFGFRCPPLRFQQPVADMSEQSDRPGSINAQPTADASAADNARSAQASPESRPVPQEAGTAKRNRKLLAGVLGVVVLAVLLLFGIPRVKEMLSTVSTDDAFVNGHVTFVASRVTGQTSRVLVDDNNRVQKGDLLAELDEEPYRVAVAEKQASVDIATADLQSATAAVRAVEAQARSRRWALQRAVQDVDNLATASANSGADTLALGRTTSK